MQKVNEEILVFQVLREYKETEDRKVLEERKVNKEQ